MLNFFRQKGLTSVVYGAIIVATILVFILGFNPSAGKKLGPLSDACVARVRGNCIEPKAHRAAYRLAFARGTPGMRQATASRFVLEGMIERELLIGEAERLGLTVSEDEITDGIFRGDIYVSLPSDNPAVGRQLGFEDGKTNVDQLIPNGYKNKDTKQFDLKVYERTVKQLVNRSPSEFREWQTRELLAAKMRDLVKAPVRVADEEVLDRYVDERSTATVSYVVVRKGWVEKYAMSPDEQGLSKRKASSVLARVKKGEDFAALAKELSDDPGSKDKGGEYPGEDVAHFVPEFQKSVAGLKPGEVDPNLVQTSFGYHIIKREPATKELIEKAYKAANATGDMDEWAKDNPQKIMVPVRHILVKDDEDKAKVDERSKEIATDIDDAMRGGKSADEAISAAIAKYAKYAPKAPKIEGDAGAPAAETFTADKDPTRPQLLTSSAFNRGGDPIPAISSGATEAIVKFAFDAKPNDVTPAPVKTDDGYIVAQLKERKAATKEELDKERDTYMLSLLATKQNEALANYVRRLRESSRQEIKVDERNLFGAKTGDAGAGDQDEE
jgi:peptidyl-prolyl cis-trans isomerase D